MALPKEKIKIGWSPDFAYAIGLIVTDGSLSKDGRHINFTSKDCEQIKNLQHALQINNLIKKKARGSEKVKKYYFIQIGDVNFYRFLEGIGLMSNKSKIIGTVNVPQCYFGDFLRGHFDGDGSFYSYFDPRWKSSYMYYTVFNSASPKHILWLQNKIYEMWGLKGHITKTVRHSCISLKYAKIESVQILKKMYYSKDILYLHRKRLKILKALYIL